MRRIGYIFAGTYNNSAASESAAVRPRLPCLAFIRTEPQREHSATVPGRNGPSRCVKPQTGQATIEWLMNAILAGSSFLSHSESHPDESMHLFLPGPGPAGTGSARSLRKQDSHGFALWLSPVDCPIDGPGGRTRVP